MNAIKMDMCNYVELYKKRNEKKYMKNEYFIKKEVKENEN